VTLEIEIELDVENWAEENGWIVRPMQYRGRRGCPDRFFFGHGHIVPIEFKRPGRGEAGLSGNQSRERKRLAGVGVTVHVIDSVDDGIRLLQGFMR
jgi:hypothetical protein